MSSLRAYLAAAPFVDPDVDAAYARHGQRDWDAETAPYYLVAAAILFLPAATPALKHLYEALNAEVAWRLRAGTRPGTVWPLNDYVAWLRWRRRPAPVFHSDGDVRACHLIRSVLPDAPGLHPQPPESL